MVQRFIIAIWTVMAVLAFGCMAWGKAPPVGSEDYDIMAPFAQAIHDLHVHGLWCCDISDGRPVDARRGGKSASGWQVRFHKNNDIGAPPDKWLDVPPDAFDPKLPPNPTGVAIAWWVGDTIRCFWPSNET